MPLGEGSHQKGVLPLKRRYFAAIGSYTVKTVADGYRLVVVVDLVSPSCATYMGEGRCPEKMIISTRLSPSWNTSDMVLDSSKYCCHSAVCVGQKKAGFQLFPLHFHNWDILEMVQTCCIIVTSTGGRVFRFVNIDDLERS